jgi:hypothetical protein
MCVLASMALAACSPAASSGSGPTGRLPSEAPRIPAQRPTAEQLIDQSSPTCPATPLEVRSGPQGSYYERDGWIIRLREPPGSWRAAQARSVLWLPTVYYSNPSFEILAEQLDASTSPHLFVARLEGPGYHSDLILPTAGCWRLTARLAEDRGSVVVAVEP